MCNCMALMSGRAALKRGSAVSKVIFSGAATMENSLVVPEKSKHGVTMGSYVSASGISSNH